MAPKARGASVERGVATLRVTRTANSVRCSSSVGTGTVLAVRDARQFAALAGTLASTTRLASMVSQACTRRTGAEEKKRDMEGRS